MKKPTYPEELSAEQHSEFTVDADTDADHVWQSAKRAVDLGLDSIEGAAFAYGLPEIGLRAYIAT